MWWTAVRCWFSGGVGARWCFRYHSHCASEDRALRAVGHYLAAAKSVTRAKITRVSAINPCSSICHWQIWRRQRGRWVRHGAGLLREAVSHINGGQVFPIRIRIAERRRSTQEELRCKLVFRTRIERIRDTCLAGGGVYHTIGGVRGGERCRRQTREHL